ncbi:MAG: hypothetical protein E6Q97_11150 [Desulfurellales bacterium]|nr:MAG: hypothetical protein E6Q97_11150 [Desulfurellales bacterium]
MPCYAYFGRQGQTELHAVIPDGPNPTIDPDEPKKLPCSNPAECAILDQIVARNRWAEWHCAVYRRSGNGEIVIMAGYNRENLKAWMEGHPEAHPPPGGFLNGYKPAPPPTVVPGHLYQVPGEEA